MPLHDIKTPQLHSAALYPLYFEKERGKGTEQWEAMSGLIMSAANQRQQCQICEGKNSRQIGWNDTVVTSTNDFFAIVLCIVEEWNPLLFLFLQRNFKILGKLYSKFRRLW